MAASIPLKVRGRARRDAAAFYLSELAKGILSGELAVLAGQHQIAVEVTEFLNLDIEVKQRKRGHRVSVTLRWPRHQALDHPRTRSRKVYPAVILP